MNEIYTVRKYVILNQVQDDIFDKISDSSQLGELAGLLKLARVYARMANTRHFDHREKSLTLLSQGKVSSISRDDKYRRAKNGRSPTRPNYKELAGLVNLTRLREDDIHLYFSKNLL